MIEADPADLAGIVSAAPGLAFARRPISAST